MAIKDDNFYIIFYWMINELGLKGSELPIFAIIYSFSQDGTNYFSGSLNYIADFAGITRQGAIKVINKLIEKGYVIKEQSKENGVLNNRYKVNIEVVNSVYRGSKLSLQGVVNSVYRGSKQSLHNNKEIIKVDNKDIQSCIDKWNKLPDPIPEVKRLTTARKSKLSARLNDFGADELSKAINLINQSSFLKGQNKNGWVITFDWFLEPRNITKILEGNFKDRSPRKLECSPNFDIEEIQRKAIMNDDFEI